MHFLDFMFLNLVAFLFSASFGFCLSVILGIEFKTDNLIIKLSIWIGLGLSIIPIIGYWLYFLGISQSVAYFAIILLMLVIAASYKFYYNRDSFHHANIVHCQQSLARQKNYRQACWRPKLHIEHRVL